MTRIAYLVICVLLVSGVALRAGEGEADAERAKDAERNRGIDKVQQSAQAMKERLKARAAEMDDQIQKLRKEGREDERVAAEQARAMLLRRMAEGDGQMPGGPGMPGDEFQQRAVVEKKQQQNTGVSRLRVKLATGAELEAEGPWLQSMPDTTREILDQFADPAKDGAVSIRLPDQIDGEGILQLRTTLLKIAPRVNVEYAEKLRLMTAASEDPVQLRRVAGVFRTLQKNYSNNNNFRQGFYDPNQNRPKNDNNNYNNGPELGPRFREREEIIKLPDGTVQRRVVPEMENAKKPKEQPRQPNNDQF